MNFNDEQKKAICHGDGPMLLLAGPGSGKTTVLTHRVKHMIEVRHVCPDNILVITFTKAAATEMKMRFEKLGPDTRGVTFGTFHSVFFRMLRSAYGCSAADIAAESEKYAVIRDSIERNGFRYDSQDDFIRNVVAEIGTVKSERRNIGEYESLSMRRDDFAVVYREYESYLRKRGKLDFDDMLVFTYELLSERPDILEAWKRKFRYILIDEFQDINRLQYDIVMLLAGESMNVFAVGDDDQSVYGFRGAAPVIMKSFPQDFRGTVIGYLNTNYRCSYDIVECSRRIIANNTDRYDKNLRSAFSAGKSDRVHVVKVADVTEQNKEIVSRLRELNSSGVLYSQMAVIYRTNTEPRALAARLSENGIPFTIKDNIPNIFTHYLAQSIFDYIRLAMGSRDRALVLRIINKPNRYIKRDAFDSEQVNFEELRQYYRDSYRMVNNINVLENDLERIGGLTPYAAVNYIRKAVGFDSYVREYADYRGVSADEYIDVLEELQESARDFGTFERWFEYIDRYTKELRRENGRGLDFKDSVTLSTMHGVKGLEYSHVFIIDAVEGITPHKKSVSSGAVEEERRLFYVAVTRARYGLYVYVPERVYGRKSQMSRFVQEMLVDRSLINVGNRIVHKKYGQGTITYVDGKKLCVYFDRLSETKTLSLEYTVRNELLSHPLS